MSTRFAIIGSLGIIVLHQAGTALALGGYAPLREALLVSGVVLLLYPLWRVARSTGHAREVLRAGPAPVAAYPIACLALILAMPLAIMLGDLVADASSRHEDLFERLLLAHGPRDWVITLLAVAVVPAIGEELLFRGFLQRGLEPRLGPIPSIAIASLAFGAIHGPARAAPATLLGALLGWIAWRTGSVRPGIVAHLLSNTAVIVAANLAAVEGGGDLKESPGWPVAIGGAALALALVVWLSRITPPVAASDPE